MLLHVVLLNLQSPRSSTGGSTSGVTTDANRPIDKQYCDAVVNFLLRIACQVNEASTTMGSPGELLSRRCVTLLKACLRPDIWPNAELKLTFFDKLLMTVETHQPNFANICTALELLCFLLGILVSQLWSLLVVFSNKKFGTRQK